MNKYTKPLLWPVIFFDITKNEFGLSAVEYVNTFFFDKAKDVGYLNEMKTRADDLGIKSLLIIIRKLMIKKVYV